MVEHDDGDLARLAVVLEKWQSEQIEVAYCLSESKANTVSSGGCSERTLLGIQPAFNCSATPPTPFVFA